MREFLIDTLTLGIVTTDLFTENEVQAAENLNNSYESQTSQYSISNVTYLVQQVKITGDNVYIGAMPNGFYKPEEMPKPIAGTFHQSQIIGFERLKVGSTIFFYGTNIYVQ